MVFVLAATLAGLIWINRDSFAVEPGSRAPAYEVYSLAGDTINISDYKGSVVVLNVWATWCGPCVREMPALERLHRELAPLGLEVIAVSVDEFDAEARVKQFGDKFKLTFPLLLDPTGNIQTAYTVNGLPTTFIIGKDGRIRQRLVGAREWADPDVVADLKKLLEG